MSRQENLLHIAVCQAVGLLNGVIHKQEESRQVHNISSTSAGRLRRRQGEGHSGLSKSPSGVHIVP